MARDILHNSDGSFVIIDGDLVIGQSDEHHVEAILLAQKGDYKQHPLVGVGLANYINSPLSGVDRLRLEREVRLQLEADNAREIKVKYGSSGTGEIEAVYE